jgi:hypothetical protein
MRHGSLLNYLRRHETTLGGNVGMLLDMCIQVRYTAGVIYLSQVFVRTSGKAVCARFKWIPIFLNSLLAIRITLYSIS